MAKSGPKPRPASERFWEKVARSDPDKCWEWTASTRKSGHGHFYPRAGKCVQAHRFAWEEIVGPIPEGMFVLHRCDNPPCVNPRHLKIGTQADNMRDRDSRNRQARGERQHLSKLTEDDVREIRSRYHAGEATGYVLAKQFGVTPSNIYYIIKKDTWKHVP